MAKGNRYEVEINTFLTDKDIYTFKMLSCPNLDPYDT